MRKTQHHTLRSAAAAFALIGAVTGVALPLSYLAAPLQAARTPTAAPTAAVRTAKILDAFGTVQQRPASAAASAPWKTVNVGDVLSEKTTLRTGDDSAALILLAGGHRIRVGAKTTVVLKELGNANSYSFRVLAGQIWSLVRKANHPARYEVETPSAVAGVTGTLFAVAYDAADSETLVSTDEGSVRVWQGNTLTHVQMGQMGRFRRLIALNSVPRRTSEIATPDTASGSGSGGRGLPDAAPPPPPAPPPVEPAPVAPGAQPAPSEPPVPRPTPRPMKRFGKTAGAVAIHSAARIAAPVSPIVSLQSPAVRRMWRLLHTEGDWTTQQTLRRPRLNRGIERDLLRTLNRADGEAAKNRPGGMPRARIKPAR